MGTLVWCLFLLLLLLSFSVYSSVLAYSRWNLSCSSHRAAFAGRRMPVYVYVRVILRPKCNLDTWSPSELPAHPVLFLFISCSENFATVSR